MHWKNNAQIRDGDGERKILIEQMAENILNRQFYFREFDYEKGIKSWGRLLNAIEKQGSEKLKEFSSQYLNSIMEDDKNE